MTLAIILALGLLVQLAAHIVWKRIFNWRYYLHLLIDSVDTDGDGKVSRAELGAEVQRRAQAAAAATTAAAAATTAAANATTAALKQASGGVKRSLLHRNESSGAGVADSSASASAGASASASDQATEQHLAAARAHAGTSAAASAIDTAVHSAAHVASQAGHCAAHAAAHAGHSAAHAAAHAGQSILHRSESSGVRVGDVRDQVTEKPHKQEDRDIDCTLLQVSNCKMYFSQIVKYICLKLQNVFVSICKIY